MNPTHKPWYRTKWGLILALIFSPFWFIWKKSRRNRFLRTIVGSAAALAVFILIASVVGHAFSSKTTGNNGSDTNGNSATTSSASTVSLHGYGATLSDWNANHTEDNGFAANTTYDPTSGLGNGYTDKYTAVLWIDGRALGYQIGFPGGTNINSAKSTAMQEFPSDATILWQQQNSSDPANVCYQMEVHSPALAEALQDSGNAFVEFQTIATSDTSTADGYYPNNVNNATIRNTDYKTASSVGGC
jgi:hypothetical protein